MQWKLAFWLSWFPNLQHLFICPCNSSDHQWLCFISAKLKIFHQECHHSLSVTFASCGMQQIFCCHLVCSSDQTWSCQQSEMIDTKSVMCMATSFAAAVLSFDMHLMFLQHLIWQHIACHQIVHCVTKQLTHSNVLKSTDHELIAWFLNKRCRKLSHWQSRWPTWHCCQTSLAFLPSSLVFLKKEISWEEMRGFWKKLHCHELICFVCLMQCSFEVILSHVFACCKLACRWSNFHFLDLWWVSDPAFVIILLSVNIFELCKHKTELFDTLSWCHDLLKHAHEHEHL